MNTNEIIEFLFKLARGECKEEDLILDLDVKQQQLENAAYVEEELKKEYNFDALILEKEQEKENLLNKVKYVEEDVQDVEDVEEEDYFCETKHERKIK